MDESVKQELIDSYNIALANMQQRHIEAMKLGFVIDDCNSMLYSILIHCMENLDIFNEIQITNISNYINKLNYVG